MDKPLLELRGVSKAFSVDKAQLEVLKDIDLQVAAGSFVSIVGHSGCGKSTLLKAVSGLLPCEGDILLHGEPVTAPSGQCGMVFQDHRLLPWLRVRENVAFGLHQLPRRERMERVEHCLALVGLTAFASAWPAQLSGGMAQRVSVARALAPRPRLLLLDEPFSALDALTRQNLQAELLRIWQAEGATMLLVTHDIDEAVYLGERVVVLSGRPGTVHADIPIALGAVRDRGSPEFFRYKKQISELLLENE